MIAQGFNAAAIMRGASIVGKSIGSHTSAKRKSKMA
jgi:hypothetical protein